jgi:hypothetical protein
MIAPIRRAAAIFLATLLASCGDSSSTGASVAAPAATTATAVKHFFIIVLENKGYDTTFGSPPPSAYLAKDLPAMGVLLHKYYGTGHASLDNYISMISGQSPNAETQADCPVYHDVLPGVPDPTQTNGIVIGQGCVYPAATLTIADQLDAAHLTWKGYMQDMGNDLARDGSATCSHPASNSQDGTESASATDQYATRHDPFVYFHSIIDDQARCDAHVVPLGGLDADLANAAATPNFVFITPDLCADGHDGSCADGTSPGGYDGIDAFLREWVPKILNSPAFKQDGMLLVTFDESDDNPTNGDDSCCGEVAGPNTTGAGAGDAGADPRFLTYSGGGLVGSVIVSPFTQAGTTSDVPYNHYSMLRSVENIFGLSHLGYAAASGLAPFGADVYSRGGVPADVQ